MLALAFTSCLTLEKYLTDLSQFRHIENEANTYSPPRDLNQIHRDDRESNILM